MDIVFDKIMKQKDKDSPKYLTKDIQEMWLNHKHYRADNFKQYLSISNWWKELGAFIGIYPRQSGKSTAIRTISTWCLTPKILVHNSISKKIYEDCGINPRKLITTFNEVQQAANKIDCPAQDIDLFVDEFMWINPELLEYIFKQNWKTLTLISSWR